MEPEQKDQLNPTKSNSSLAPMSLFQRYKDAKLQKPQVAPSADAGPSLAERILEASYRKPDPRVIRKAPVSAAGDRVAEPSVRINAEAGTPVSGDNKTGDQGGVPASADVTAANDVTNQESTTEAGSTAVVVTKVNAITVSPRQKGNPLLKNIRNVPWEYGDIIPDYVMGKTACALFLSLRYHHLHPNYIHNRLKELGNSFELRVLLVLVDSKDPQHSLKELAKICMLANCTLILAWSNEEAGRYLETYKSFENKPPDILMERTGKNQNAQMMDCLTSVKSVNKTDALTLISAFGSFANVSKATLDDLSLCPGFGPQKKQRLYDVFRTPFMKTDLLASGSSAESPTLGGQATDSPSKRPAKSSSPRNALPTKRAKSGSETGFS